MRKRQPSRASAVPSARPGPAHSHGRAPRRAGPPRGRRWWKRPQGAGLPLSLLLPCRQGDPGSHGRTGGALSDAAAAPACPRSSGALPGASRNIPSWGPWWNRHPRSSPEEARREEHENNCSPSFHDVVSEGNRTSLFHPAGWEHGAFPCRGCLSSAQERFQALALEGGRRGHARPGCGSAESAGHAGPPGSSQPGPAAPAPCSARGISAFCGHPHGYQQCPAMRHHRNVSML